MGIKVSIHQPCFPRLTPFKWGPSYTNLGTDLQEIKTSLKDVVSLVNQRLPVAIPTEENVEEAIAKERLTFLKTGFCVAGITGFAAGILGPVLITRQPKVPTGLYYGIGGTLAGSIFLGVALYYLLFGRAKSPYATIYYRILIGFYYGLTLTPAFLLAMAAFVPEAALKWVGIAYSLVFVAFCLIICVCSTPSTPAAQG